MKTIKKTDLATGIPTTIFIPKLERTIEWFGGVDFENLQEILSKIKSFVIKDKNEEIHLMVNSYGGATGIGLSFYDAVTSWMKPNLVTVGSGYVDSSGIIIFLAGKKRFLTKNTTLLLHLGGRTFGTDKRFSTMDMENTLKEDKLKDYQYACVVADATKGKYTPEKIMEMMAKNTILTAEEAVAMGLAEAILE